MTCRRHDHGVAFSRQPRPSGRMFKVSDLDCAEEVAVLKREIRAARGQPDPCIRYFERPDDGCRVRRQRVPNRDIEAAVRRTGMSASRWRDQRGQGWPQRAQPPPAGLVDDGERRLGPDRSGVHPWLAGGIWEALRLLSHSGQITPARDHRLRVRDRFGRSLRPGEGVARCPAPAAGHEPADDRRRRRRDRDRRVVRGGHGRLPVRTLAGARELERRPRAPGHRGAARSVARRPCDGVRHRR